MGRFDDDSDSPLFGEGMSELRSKEIEREEERLRQMEIDQRRRQDLVRSAQLQARMGVQQAEEIKKQADRIKKLRRIRRIRCLGCCFSTTFLWILLVVTIIVVVVTSLASIVDLLDSMWQSIKGFFGFSSLVETGANQSGAVPTDSVIQKVIDFINKNL